MERKEKFIELIKDAHQMEHMVLGILEQHIGDDKIVKNGISDYSIEQLEIATYLALISMAKDLGESESGDLFTQLMREEEEMASWLQSNLPVLVQRYLNMD